jgi:hypothetical protein
MTLTTTYAPPVPPAGSQLLGSIVGEPPKMIDKRVDVARYRVANVDCVAEPRLTQELQSILLEI